MPLKKPASPIYPKANSAENHAQGDSSEGMELPSEPTVEWRQQYIQKKSWRSRDKAKGESNKAT